MLVPRFSTRNQSVNSWFLHPQSQRSHENHQPHSRSIGPLKPTVLWSHQSCSSAILYLPFLLVSGLPQTFGIKRNYHLPWHKEMTELAPGYGTGGGSEQCDWSGDLVLMYWHWLREEGSSNLQVGVQHKCWPSGLIDWSFYALSLRKRAMGLVWNVHLRLLNVSKAYLIWRYIYYDDVMDLVHANVLFARGQWPLVAAQKNISQHKIIVVIGGDYLRHAILMSD